MNCVRFALAATALMMASASAHAQWSLNGVKVFYNAGNVGIGTNNPAYTLEVRSAGPRAIFGIATPATGFNYGVYGQTNSVDGRAVYALANSATGTNYAVVGKTNSASGYAAWFVGGRNYFEGRVGIGGPNPSQKLQVNGNVKVTGWIGSDVSAPVEFRSKNNRVLWMKWVTANQVDSVNFLGGHDVNAIGAGVIGATITGGGYTSLGVDIPNTVNGDFGTISGGYANTVTGLGGTVGGGHSNTAAERAYVGGGDHNNANGVASAILGGSSNGTDALNAVVVGGTRNDANGDNSVAAGRRAKAMHAGTLVWGDNTNADFSSTAENQVLVRASGGIWLGTNSAPDIPETDFINTSTGAHLTTGGTWTNASSKDLKENFSAISPREILQKVINMSITKWNYKAEGKNISHLGPVSQDFAQAFGLGVDDKSIATVDADGVALAAIQGLHQIVKEKDQQIELQQRQLSSQQQQIEQLMARMAQLEASLGRTK